MARARLLPALLLLGYAVAFASRSLGASLPAFDDHPGQLFRLWHVVTRGPAPWAWEPGWWAGYPELQFYPPGFAYLGALLHASSLGALAPAAAYQALLWIAYLAPGVTTLWLLVRLLGDPWLALPGAFVALTLSAGVASGVEGGVHVGMVAARLGWALLPLLLVAVAGWAERGGQPPPAVAPLVAAVALIHPAHLPAAVATVALAAAGPRPRSIGRALAPLALAAALSGFWTLPLLARLGYTRPLAWGTLSLRAIAGALATQPLVLVLVLLAVYEVAAARRGSAAAVVARLPWILALAVLADAALVEPLGARFLPADRLMDSVWLALLLAAGVATGRLLGGLARKLGVVRPALSLAAVAAAAALSLAGGTLSIWPRAADWPSYVATARGLRLADLWATLRAAPPGRIFFVRSAIPLVYGTAWYRPHTHVTALTPLLAGRAIVNGTFTHPSPIAALVYQGSTEGPITRLVEQLDGRSLFGRPLEALDAATLAALTDRLGVSALVALDEDAPRLAGLDAGGAFARRPAPEPFVVYARRVPPAVPAEIAPDHWRIDLAGEPGGWASARVAAYPLWRAASDGVPLETRRGRLGDLEVRLARPGATVDLFYEAGLPERAGLVLSGLALLAWLGSWRLGRGPHAAHSGRIA